MDPQTTRLVHLRNKVDLLLNHFRGKRTSTRVFVFVSVSVSAYILIDKPSFERLTLDL